MKDNDKNIILSLWKNNNKTSTVYTHDLQEEQDKLYTEEISDGITFNKTKFKTIFKQQNHNDEEFSNYDTQPDYI